MVTIASHFHIDTRSYIKNSPRDHALQNQTGAKLYDQHVTGTHVVMRLHLDASALAEATKSLKIRKVGDC